MSTGFFSQLKPVPSSERSVRQSLLFRLNTTSTLPPVTTGVGLWIATWWVALDSLQSSLSGDQVAPSSWLTLYLYVCDVYIIAAHVSICMHICECKYVSAIKLAPRWLCYLILLVVEIDGGG